MKYQALLQRVRGFGSSEGANADAAEALDHMGKLQAINQANGRPLNCGVPWSDADARRVLEFAHTGCKPDVAAALLQRKPIELKILARKQGWAWGREEKQDLHAA